MFKKLICFILFFSCTITYAETCPTVDEIKAGNFKGWQAFGLDSGEPASSEELDDFKSSIATFQSAAWMPDAPEGSAQCYYGTAEDPYENVYLAKTNQGPDLTAYWQPADDGMQCRVTDSKVEHCRFKS